MDRQRALSARYDSMIAQMGADPARYPLHFSRSDTGATHVEPLPDGAWLWQVTDRGKVLYEARFADEDALLYRLVCDVAAAEGSDWQARHPVAGKDPRRADFARRLELVGRVSPAWRIRLAEELAQWLARHPYSDRPAEHQSQRAKGWIGLAIVAALICGWAAAHYPLWSVWQQQHHLETEGFGVPAEVIERDRTNGKFADEYFLTYRYQGATRQLTGRDSVDWLTFHRTEPEGSTLEILYDPADQETSMVAGNDRAGRLAWIYAVIDALLAAIIVGGWWKSRRAAAAG